jgi:hypothetical protein
MCDGPVGFIALERARGVASGVCVAEAALTI